MPRASPNASPTSAPSTASVSPLRSPSPEAGSPATSLRPRGAGQWFAGGVVAYSSDVKHRLLNVPPGPVISYQAEEMMARTTCEMTDAEAAGAGSGAG